MITASPPHHRTLNILPTNSQHTITILLITLWSLQYTWLVVWATMQEFVKSTLALSRHTFFHFQIIMDNCMQYCIHRPFACCS